MAGMTTPPDGDPERLSGYYPGEQPRSSTYDRPRGSQGQYVAPEDQRTVSADSNQQLFFGEDDTDAVFTTSPLNPEDRNYATLSGSDFNEEDGYIALPVDVEP